jgi:hypothetical protein
MSLQETNPRAVVGDNQAPAYAERVSEALKRDYGALEQGIDSLLTEARAAPKEANDDPTAAQLGLIVKQLHDAYARAESYRTAEKEPHLRAGQAVDAWFKGLQGKLRRHNPKDRHEQPGAADILQARIDDFLERKRLAEEQARRAEAARLAAEARARADEEARARLAAADAAAAAERARNADRIAEKSALAKVEAERAAAAAIEAEVARQAAQEAHIATLAKPADMSRTRGDGVLLTQAREGYVILTDRNQISLATLEVLLPYLTDAELEKAARGFARTTNHSRQLDGFEIGFRRKGVTR